MAFSDYPNANYVKVTSKSGYMLPPALRGQGLKYEFSGHWTTHTLPRIAYERSQTSSVGFAVCYDRLPGPILAPTYSSLSRNFATVKPFRGVARLVVLAVVLAEPLDC